MMTILKSETHHGMIGAGTLIESGVQIGFRYDSGAGPARIGAHGILRSGTIIYGDVAAGDWFQTGHYTVIRAKVRVGDYCTVSNHSILEGIIRLGDGVRIMSNVYIPSRTWIGNDVFIGPCVTFLNDRLPGRLDRPQIPKGAMIEDDVVIGGGCTILPGVRIGRKSFIAAGALVTKDVPEASFVIGTPGRISPLPAMLDRRNNEALTRQPFDLWHPKSTSSSKPEWPSDWPEGESWQSFPLQS